MLSKDDLTYYINYFFEKLKDEVSYEERVSISLEAAEIFIMVGDLKSAKEIVSKLLKSEDFPNFKTEIKYKILNMMHKVLYKEGNFEEAENILKKTLEIVGDSEKFRCRVFVKLGNLYIRMDKFEDAKKYYTQAIDIGEQVEERECLASAYNNVAVYYAMTNRDYDKALMFLQKALSLYENVKPNSSITGRILANLGKLFKEKKLYGKAQDYYQKAHTIATKLKQYDLLAHIYLGKSELYFEMGEYDVSKIFAEKALSYYKLVNGKESITWMAEVYILLAKISSQISESFETVEKILGNAIELVNGVGDWKRLVSLYDLGCDLALKYGYKTKAKELLEKGIKIAESYNLQNEANRLKDKLNYINL